MRKLAVSSTLCLAILLSACGGGGGGGDSQESLPPSPNQPQPQPQPQPIPKSSAEGLWSRTTSRNQSIDGLILSNGDFYVFYSVENMPGIINGCIVGQGHSESGRFTSNALEFNTDGGSPIYRPSISATYAAKSTLGGDVIYSPSEKVTFQASYLSDYETKPSLAVIAGNYREDRGSYLNIATNGAISGNDDGCTYTGVVSPHSDANAYDFSVKFGTTNCLAPGKTFNGVAYYQSTHQRLYAIALDASRTNALVFSGGKQP